MLLITLFCLLFCAIWILMLAYLHLALRRIPAFESETVDLAGAEGGWPRLSIIVPACNEARHIEAALETLLAQDYPDFEIVAIDDRSTDATGDILERLAARDGRIRLVRVETLPEGWLGKVHALHQGVRQADGEWLLFTDADVYFAADTLRRAIAYARQRRLHHLVCVPEVHPSGFWLDVVMRTFFLMFCVSARLAEVDSANNGRPAGIGAFNLVETETFRRTPGFEWLRMEPVDDYGLGLMIHRAGARTGLLRAESAVSVHWYESLGAMTGGLEKNSFGPAAGYSWVRLTASMAALWSLVAAPWIALAVGLMASSTPLIASFVVTVAATLGFAFTAPRRSARDIAAHLALPTGVLLLSFIVLRSAWLCQRNRGIDWRGTHYSLQQLRDGQRVRF